MRGGSEFVRHLELTPRQPTAATEMHRAHPGILPMKSPDQGANTEEQMLHFLKLAGALVTATLFATAPVSAQTTVYSAGDTTSGTYMDYMKTVYARAGNPEIIQLPLTSFDNDYVLNPMAAESWTQSEDGLTWTFKLRSGLVWSDGEPLRASDYIFALQRAATTGYDFAW